VKENVLPSHARAVVNFRLIPGDTTESVLTRVREIVSDPDITVAPLTRTMAEAAPVSGVGTPGYELIAAVARRSYPDAIVVPVMVNGATDSRHLTPIADDVYRFVPRLYEREDLKRLHGTNERASIEDLGRGIDAYREILEAGAGSSSR
jgi:carboxypeptidase PM20D1